MEILSTPYFDCVDITIDTSSDDVPTIEGEYVGSFMF